MSSTPLQSYINKMYQVILLVLGEEKKKFKVLLKVPF